MSKSPPQTSNLVQVVYPNLGQKTEAGWCLKFVQDAFGAPVMHETATIAANSVEDANPSRDMPDVSVPVWFWHYGTYGGVSGEYGHVVIWVPGSGFLSSPVAGYGQKWLPSIESVERTFNAKYRFWSRDINTLQVVKPVNKPGGTSPKEVRRKSVIGLRIVDGEGRYGSKGSSRYATYDGRAFVQISEGDANSISQQIGRFANVSYDTWERYQKVSEVNS